MLGQRLVDPASQGGLAALRFAEQRSERPLVTIAADTCHTLCVGREGDVWAWGGHEQGPSEEEDDAPPDDEWPCWLLHLGLGREAGPCVTRPTPVRGLPVGVVVIEVAAGYEHSLLRCAAGHIYSCGVGKHGRLGHGLPLASLSQPRRIDALEHVAQCAAGGFQSLAVTDSGAAYSWGWGESGSIGHGNREHQYTPKLIEALAGGRVVQASAGSGHALFLTDDGALHACGDFRHGKLGLGKAISEDALSPQLVPFPKGVRVAQCSAWHAHSLTVTAAGELFSFGCGEDGRLGHGDEKAHWRPTAVKFFHAGLRVKYAAAGELHSCVLTTSGHVYAFGDCSLGQTGRTQWDPLLKPKRVGVPERVRELAVGDHHTLVRTLTGQLFSFGKNLEGQLGLGTTGVGKVSVAEPSRVRWSEEAAGAPGTPQSSSSAQSEAGPSSEAPGSG